jgi:hypothetical protein
MDATADAPPRPEFLALGGFYKSELEPWLAAQEGRRRKARILRLVIIGGGLPALAVWLFVVLSGDWSGFWAFLILVLGLVVIAVGNIPIWRLQADVKKFVLEKLASFFHFTYTAEPDFVDVPLFNDLGLLPHHDKRNFEDGLEGEIKGVPFRMVEARLTESRGTGKNKRTVTVFRGLLLSLPYATRGQDTLSVWRRKLDIWMSDDDLREVTLGDPPSTTPTWCTPSTRRPPVACSIATCAPPSRRSIDMRRPVTSASASPKAACCSSSTPAATVSRPAR